MKFWKSQIFKNYLILTMGLFIIEIVVKLCLGNAIFVWQTLRIFVGSSIIGLLFAIINTACGKKTARVLNVLFIFGVGVLALAQLGFVNYIGTFMSLNSSSQAGKVTSYIKDYIMSLLWPFFFTMGPFLILLIYYIVVEGIILKKNEEYKIDNKNRNFRKCFLSVIKYVAIFIALGGFYLFTVKSTFFQNKYQTTSNWSLFVDPEIQSTSVNQFGILGFQILDLRVYLFGNDGLDTELIYKNNGSKKIPVTDYTRTIDDTAWDQVIAAEQNKTYAQLHNYFINQTITPKNQYTGLLEGKNLIYILMESTNMIATLDYFPTLSKMYNEGYGFSNFYSPRNSCSTGNNELTSIVSLFTINNSCTSNTYKKNKYPESLFYEFKEQGYKITSYHDYIDAYYSRPTIHKNLGSDKYYNVTALGIPYDSVYQEWPSDIDLMKKAIPTFINEDKFVAYISSVSPHQPYTVNSELGSKNIDLFKDVDVSTSTKRYMSKLYELDQALAYLLQELESYGKLDDTVIVLFGDHYPYGLSTRQIVSLLGEEVTTNKNIDRTPLIIYNSALGTKKVETYGAIVDIAPTIMNLFNLDYDPRLYTGTDIFSPDQDHKTVFADGSWEDEVGFFQASTGVFNPKNETITYTDDEIVEFNTVINNKIKMSNIAIKNNYFNHLYTELDKYIVKDEVSSSSESISSVTE